MVGTNRRAVRVYSALPAVAPYQNIAPVDTSAETRQTAFPFSKWTGLR
jgi:hypothetical protein